MSKIQISNINEREVEKLNSPRKLVFVSDVLENALLFIVGTALFFAAIYGIGVIVEATNYLMGV